MQIINEFLLIIFIVIDNDIILWFIRLPEFRTEYCFTEMGKFKYSFVYIVSIIQRDIPVLRFWLPHFWWHLYNVYTGRL